MNFERLLGVPARRPGRTLLIAAALAVCAALLVTRLHPSNSLDALIAQDDEAAVALHHLLTDFSTVDDLLLLVSCDADQADERANRLTGFARRLERAAAEDADLSPMISGVQYRTGDEGRRFVEQIIAPAGAYYLDNVHFRALKQRLEPGAIREQIRRNEAMMSAASPAASALSAVILRDPLRLHELVGDALKGMKPPGDSYGGSDATLTADARSLLIRISGHEPATHFDFTHKLMAGVRRAIAAADPGDLRVELSGGYAIAENSEKTIRGDMIVNTVSSIVMLQVLFLIAYRRLWSFGLIFGPVALGVLYAFGVYALFETQITPMTAALGGIMAGLGIDYCIHFAAHFDHRRRKGQTVIEAATMSLPHARDLLAAAATSVMGFAAIWASRVPALREFSVIGMLGLVGSFVAALTVLPAVTVLLSRGGATGTQRWAMDRFVEHVLRRRRLYAVVIGGVTVVSTIVCAVALSGGAFESDLRVMHPQPNEPLEVQEKISGRFAGLGEAMVIHLHADSPEKLAALAHAVSRRLKSTAVAAAGVSRSLGIDSLLPDPAIAAKRPAELATIDVERVIGDFTAAVNDSTFDLEAYRPYLQFLRQVLRPGAPPSVADLAKYPGLTRPLLPKAAFGDAAQPITQAVTLAMTDKRFGSRDERDAAINAIRSAVRDLPGAALTGVSVIGHDIEAGVRRDLPRLLGLSFVLVLGWLLMEFRSLSASLLAMGPTVIGMVVGLAAMAASGAKLNMVNIVAMPILAGVGVDYGIFVVSVMVRAKRGANVAEMLGGLPASIAAINMCSLTTLLGFGSLITSHTPAVCSLGLLLGAGIIGCWGGAVLVLLPLAWRAAERSTKLPE